MVTHSNTNKETSHEGRPHGKVLVTGGSGHLGANLVRRLLAEGHAVCALARHESNNAALDGLDIEWRFGDLRDLESVHRAVSGCVRVYHCAAKLSTTLATAAEKRAIFECNVVGTKNLLAAAREAGVERVVVTGSFSATGYHLDDPSKPAAEPMPFYPFSDPMPYEQSKAQVEHECLKACVEGQDVVIATSCAILGPNDFKPSRMGKALCDFAGKRLPAYIPGGFEFVSTHDIVEGHILAMARGRSGQKYIFSTQFLTMDDVMAAFEQATGRRRPWMRLPTPLMAGVSQVSSFVLSRFFPEVPQRLTPGAVRILSMERHADTTKARQELGYEPTSIQRAIDEAYADFVRRGVISPVR